MSDFSPKLPTDSLYKMLTIGGIVLVASAVLVFMRQIESVAELDREYSLARAAFVQSGAKLRVHFEEFLGEVTALADEVKLVDPEFAHDYPLAVSVDNNSSTPLDRPHEDFSFESWVTTINVNKRFLGAVAEWCDVQSVEVSSIRAKAIRLSEKVDVLGKDIDVVILPEREFRAAAFRKSDLVGNVAKVRVYGCLFLLTMGVYVFTRASVNWYNESQRHQDAILRAEALECDVEVTAKVSLPIEILKLAVALAVPLIWLDPLDTILRLILGAAACFVITFAWFVIQEAGGVKAICKWFLRSIRRV